MWKTVLFDLDGTLTDSAEGITKCVQHALVQLGCEAPELEELNCFVGPPLKAMFMSYAGLSEEEGEKAVALYRERYVPIGMFENRLYPRIVQMLELFQKAGITMAVASSKPEEYVKQILEHFGIDDYFKVIVGCELGGARVEKKDVVEEAIRRLKMEHHKDQIVLVGDTKYDVEGARKAGIECIAVTYGYGETEELAAAEPVYLAESVSDVAECVLAQQRKSYKETVAIQLWRMIYPVLMHLSASSVVAYVALFGVLILSNILYGTADPGQSADLINSYSMVIQIVTNAALIPIAWKLLQKDEWKRKDQGLRSRIMVAESLKPGRIALILAFFITLSVLLNQLIAWSGLHQLFPAYEAIAESVYNENQMLVSYLAVVLLAPFAEELIYRGLAYRRIRDYVGIRWAVLMSAAIFGIIHGNMVQFIFAFMMGLAMALIYERYRTIWAPIIAHMAVNLFSCATEFAGVKILPESDVAAVGLFAAEGMVVVITGLILFDKWLPKKTAESEETGKC